MMKATCLLLLIITAAVVVAPPLTEAAESQMSCGSVTSALAPCFQYVISGGVVPINCCDAVRTLYKEAATTAARREICVCLKSITGSASAATLNNAKSLPGKCGLSIPYEISPTIDCTKVN